MNRSARTENGARIMARELTQFALPSASAAPRRLSTSPTPRLRLAPDGAGRGVIDGGWWPRSRDADAELTALLTVLGRAGETAEPATRVAVDFEDWDGIPQCVTVLGCEVKVGRAAYLGHMVAVTSGRADPLLLLVVPPGATPSAAEAALARSVIETGDVMPREILASCDISTLRV